MFNFQQYPEPKVVAKTADGKPEEIRWVMPDGEVVERETIAYDDKGEPSRRRVFDRDGMLSRFETWTRDQAGQLLEHEHKQGDGTPIAIEKWTRDETGKLLYAEAWLYDEDGNEVRYQKQEANAAGALVSPGRAVAVWALRFFCFGVGVWCMFSMLNAIAAGQTGLALFSGVLMLLNFWNGVRKR